ncbi:MAG: hypothetical protein HUJ25_03030 [Crocinitomicaceae bacterium]|nr:hypothetical protein [Crocinitomicaceae bacterium]
MNEIISLIIVAALCIFWIFLFGRAFYRSVANRKEADPHSGRIVTGKIISSTSKGAGPLKTMSIVVEFPNFSNAKVRETFNFKDTKPSQNRYEEGNSVQLVLREDDKNGPSVELSGAQKRGSNLASFIFFVFTAGAIYGTYVLYELVDQQIDGNWNNIDQLQIQEGLALTGGIFILTLLFMRFIFKRFGLFPSKESIKSNKELKLYGLSATAKVTNVQETGMKINNNPVIEFHYEFEDQFGTSHKGKDRMVMGMIELANIGDIEQKDVIYLKDDPGNSRISDAMQKGMMTGCMKLIFLQMTLVFTGIIIGMFVSSLLNMS